MIRAFLGAAAVVWDSIGGGENLRPLDGESIEFRVVQNYGVGGFNGWEGEHGVRLRVALCLAIARRD